MNVRKSDTPKSRLRVACIGAGNSGFQQMIRLELFEPGCCVAFCDLSRVLFDEIVGSYFAACPSSGDGDFKIEVPNLRAGFRNLPYYRDPEEMFAKEDINTVVISCYDSAHAEMVERCVKHEMNILLEKPIATTRADVEKVWRLLKDYPKVATVNFTMRGATVSLAAQKHVRQGDIGKIVSVQYVNNVHYGDNYFRKWMRTQKHIGSLLLEKATHDFDMINAIIDLRPVSVAAFGSRQFYGGQMPNDLTCDACEKKWSCPMSIYRRQLDAAKRLPRKHLRRCVFAQEIDIDDNHVVIIQYEGGVTCSYSQTFNAPARGGQRGGYFVGTEGILELKYYGDFVESPRGETILGTSHIDITRLHAKPGTKIHEVYDWGDHSHFDGTEYGVLAKLDLLHGRPTAVANTIEEGYISARMGLAAQESIETGKVITLDLNL